MKKTFLLTFGCFWVVALSAQSQIKTSLIYAGTASQSGLGGNPNFGFSLGHQHHLFSRTKFKVLMTENLEYKKAGFVYYNSGFGGIVHTKGDINFVNVKVDTRARIGKDFFFDAGLTLLMLYSIQFQMVKLHISKIALQQMLIKGLAQNPLIKIFTIILTI
jgi:hypothetical protein